MDFPAFVQKLANASQPLIDWWNSLRNDCPLRANIQQDLLLHEDQDGTTTYSRAQRELGVCGDRLIAISGDPLNRLRSAMAEGDPPILLQMGPSFHEDGSTSERLDLCKMVAVRTLVDYVFDPASDPGGDIDFYCQSLEEGDYHAYLGPDSKISGLRPTVFWAFLEDIQAWLDGGYVAHSDFVRLLGLEENPSASTPCAFIGLSADGQHLTAHAPTGFDAFDHRYFQSARPTERHGRVKNLHPAGNGIEIREVVTQPVPAKDTRFLRLVR